MFKKMTAFILTASLLTGIFSFTAYAKPAKIDEKTARNIAVFYLAALEPVTLPDGKDPVKIGSDFTLLAGKTFFNADNEPAFYNFNFTGSKDKSINGTITVSVNSDLPYVMEQKFGPSPYDGSGIEKTYYISPLVYFNKMADGTFLNQDGKPVSFSDIQSCFNDYENYRSGLYAQNAGFIEAVKQENAQMLAAINSIKASSMYPDWFQRIYDYVYDVLFYFIDSVWHTGDIAQINARVEEIIKTHAGEGYSKACSYVVDKTAMVPQYQSYYQNDVGNGICGKASSMMVLAFFRDGKGYTALPADNHAMYAEFSAIYDEMTQYFSFFFANPVINEELGLYNSYEMTGTLDMGLAYYLYSKGYTAAAQNVIDNACFAVTMVPDAVCGALMTALRAAMSGWLEEKTNGELTFLTGKNDDPNDVIINSLKSGEPIVIGCLTAIGCSWFSNHYFAGVGYYKMECPVQKDGITLYTLSKEYVEVYDTWGHDSSVINWSVFKSTALYSATSLADLG